MRTSAVAAWVLLLALAARTQDVVELENGKRHEGLVVYADDETVVLRSGGPRGGKDRSFAREEVAVLETRKESLRELLNRSLEIDEGDVQGNLGLADFARRNGLEGEARLFLLRVLLVDPDHEEANERLEHRKRGKQWTLPHRGRHYPLEKLHELCSDWGGAWELETLHYEVRTNLPLDRGIAAALDLERTYLALYDRFAEAFGMYEATETMKAHLHGDARSFPQSGTRTAFFSAGENTLRVEASVELAQDILVHEATHQILFTVAAREKTNTGSVPAWVDEGLAEYMAATIEGVPGKLRLDQDPLNLGHFRAHVDAEKPFALSRVLNFRVSDFEAGSRSALAYSQSYTLVHFLLHFDDGAFRDGFHAFVRGNFRGKRSASHFKKAVGMDDDDLEERWNFYAYEMTGG